VKKILLRGGLPLAFLSLAACSDDPVGPSKGQIGSLEQYNVKTDAPCLSPDYRTGRVVGVGKHALVVADTTNPSGGFTEAEYQAIANSFDALVYPLITDFFGAPADIDSNGRVVIFYTRAVNELTKAGSDSYIAGFFHPRDLFPKTSTSRLEGCAGSNEAEIFYMLVPDPSGVVNGNKRSKALVQGSTIGTIAHELQHLINGSRRLYVNNAADWEAPWLNEGLSHIAEELLFYHASRLTTKQNIDLDRLRSSQAAVDAFNAYQGENFGRLERFFRSPESQAAYSDSVGLGVRGAVWHYLRYLADRSGSGERDFWYRLANSTASGFTNLQQVMGQDPMPLYRDWTVTTYTDDLVATRSPNFQQPSWDHRSIIPAIITNAMLPQPRTLIAATPQRVTLWGGGTTYLQFGVVPLQRAEIQVTPAAGIPTSGACTAEMPPVVLEVGEAYTPPAGGAAVLCVDGGTGGGDYVIVATSAARDVASSRIVTVTGYGITAPLAAAPLLAASQTAAPLAVFQEARAHTSLVVSRLGRRAAPRAAEAGDDALTRDFSLDLRIRQQEITELSPRPGGGQPRLRAALQEIPGGGVDELYVSLVRIR
jgi:hypothetical protein